MFFNKKMAIFVCIFFCLTSSCRKMSSVAVNGFGTLPLFVTEDIFGNSVDSRKLQTNPLLVLFLDPKNTEELSFFRSSYENVFADGMNIIVFVKNVDGFWREVQNKKTELIVVDDSGNTFRRIFGASECCGSYYFFEKAGKLKASGLLVEDYYRNLRSSLEEITKSNRCDLSLVINRKSILGDESLIGFLRERLDMTTKGLILAAFFDLCISCESGAVLDNLRFLCEGLNDVKKVMLISNNFTTNDIRNILDVLPGEWEVMKASSQTESYWREMIYKCGKKRYEALAVWLDKEFEIVGTIIGHKKEGCFAVQKGG
jgi:hypothetical protein